MESSTPRLLYEPEPHKTIGPRTKGTNKRMSLIPSVVKKLANGEEVIDRRRMQSSLAPNIIHNMGAWAMCTATQILQSLGCYPLTIHDSFLVSVHHAELFLGCAPRVYAHVGYNFIYLLAEKIHEAALRASKDPVKDNKSKKSKARKKKTWLSEGALLRHLEQESAPHDRKPRNLAQERQFARDTKQAPNKQKGDLVVSENDNEKK